VSSHSAELSRVRAVLDDFHGAAAAADEGRYLACLAPEAVFLGTDPHERWAGDAFRQFVRRNFTRGGGWTYTTEDRSVEVGLDGRTAWFDERLRNEWYGECRGTGVVQLREGEWRIEQYSLSLPVPNGVAEDVVTKIREVS
jgi:hypothetical protein